MNRVTPALWALRSLAVGGAVATLAFLVIRRQLQATEAAERVAMVPVPSAPAVESEEGALGDPGPAPNAVVNTVTGSTNPGGYYMGGTKSAEVMRPSELMEGMRPSELMKPPPRLPAVAQQSPAPLNPPPPPQPPGDWMAYSSKSGRVLSPGDMKLAQTNAAQIRAEQAQAAAKVAQAQARAKATAAAPKFAPSSKSAMVVSPDDVKLAEANAARAREDAVRAAAAKKLQQQRQAQQQQQTGPAAQPAPRPAQSFAPSSKSRAVLEPADFKPRQQQAEPSAVQSQRQQP